MAPHTALMAAMGGEGKIVEGDETFVGGPAKNMHRGKRAQKIKGTGGAGKEAVSNSLGVSDRCEAQTPKTREGLGNERPFGERRRNMPELQRHGN